MTYPLRLRTPQRHGHSVQFSPFKPKLLACATGQYYGIAGCGTLFVAYLEAQGTPVVKQWMWNDCLFDLCWSDTNENVLLTAGGDGFVLVFDIGNDQGPIVATKAHDREVYSISWCQERTNNHLAASASWDGSLTIWDVMAGCRTVASVSAHNSLIYSAQWSPRIRGMLASVAGDGSVHIWDAGDLTRPRMALQQAHASDVLTCDWCKYDEHVLATGGSDGLIRMWDVRSLRSGRPLCDLAGHGYAVRRLKFSPFEKGVILSSSYDYTTRLWDYEKHNHNIGLYKYHTEFTCGIDFSFHEQGQVADCSWDESICIYPVRPLS